MNDIVPVSKKKANLPRELSRWKSALEKRLFTISKTKTKYIVFTPSGMETK